MLFTSVALRRQVFSRCKHGYQIRVTLESRWKQRAKKPKKQSDVGEKSEPGDQNPVFSQINNWFFLLLHLDYKDKELPVTSCNFLCLQIEQRGEMNHVWKLFNFSRQTDRQSGGPGVPARGGSRDRLGGNPSVDDHLLRPLPGEIKPSH